MEIESETRFLWRILLDIALTPVRLIQLLFRKGEASGLFKPWKDLFTFLFEPRFTIGMVLLTIGTSAVFWLYVPQATQEALLRYPSDLLSPARFYSFVTSGFIHMNLKHLLSNMLFLYIFGRVVEKRHGFAKTGLIYLGALLVSGIGDSVVALLLGETRGSLGASGAIMGLMGAAMLSDPFYFTYMLLIPMPVMVAAWLYIYTDIVGILGAADDGIGHFAHLFGFLSVTLTLFILGERKELQKGLIINLVSLAIAAMLYFLVIAGYLPNPLAMLNNMLN
jgi:membrane associated rhomboid family serine protease